MPHPQGKIVCVTGAGGSIGTELCKKLLSYPAAELRAVSISENALFNLRKELHEIAANMDVPVRYYLGDVSNPALMDSVLKGCDIVVHAAAHKHVPICEENPLEAIRNNVGGTYQLACAAMRQKVKQFVLISSDKAVKPSSVMGATKRVAELMLRDIFTHGPTEFLTVRFGNVLDSAGSVLPLWREQMRNGGPVTITDPNCTRYFLSIPDAVGLVIRAITLGANNAATPNWPYVLDMGKPKRMGDLLNTLLFEALENGELLDMEITGLRPGEKLHEELDYGGTVCDTTVPGVRYIEEPLGRTLTAKDVLSLLFFVEDFDAPRALLKLMEIVR